MDIFVELPESSKPEKAWMERDVLMVDYHLYSKELFYYVDAHHDIPVVHIVAYTMYYGTRKGFKRMELTFRHPKDRHLVFFKLSANHEQLVVEIYNLLKQANIKPRREIVKKEVRN